MLTRLMFATGAVFRHCKWGRSRNLALLEYFLPLVPLRPLCLQYCTIYLTTSDYKRDLLNAKLELSKRAKLLTCLLSRSDEKRVTEAIPAIDALTKSLFEADKTFSNAQAKLREEQQAWENDNRKRQKVIENLDGTRATLELEVTSLQAETVELKTELNDNRRQHMSYIDRLRDAQEHTHQFQMARVQTIGTEREAEMKKELNAVVAARDEDIRRAKLEAQKPLTHTIIELQDENEALREQLEASQVAQARADQDKSLRQTVAYLKEELAGTAELVLQHRSHELSAPHTTSSPTFRPTLEQPPPEVSL